MTTTLDPNAWAQELAERLDPTPSPYADDPVLWTKDVANEWTTDDQKSIMRSVVANRYTAVQSCHDTGKSFTASRIVAWWLDSHPAGEAFVVTTAPTAAQVGTVLWREIGKVHRSADLFGYITGDNKWKIDHAGSSPEEVAIGRKPADHDPAALQGHHARYVLVIIDEACGVPKVLYEALDSLVTNEYCRVLAVGNPDDPSAYFADVCKPGSGWAIIHLDALRSPNFTKAAVAKYPAVRKLMIQEGIAPTTEVIPEDLRAMLISPLWVDERIKRWGIDSPVFAAKVRGLFPNVSIDTLIHPHFIECAKVRDIIPQPMVAKMGVDVARYGVDHTIIFMRQGGHARVVEDIPYGPTTHTARRVLEIGVGLHDGQLPTACVDDSGVGGGVVDILEEKGYPVVPIVAGERSIQLLKNGKPRFVNYRSELMWSLREALAGPSGTGDDGWLDLDPLDIELHGQLTAIKYRINQYGQIAVESKDEMKSRGLSSPDRADALSYSLSPKESTVHVLANQMLTGHLLEERW